MLVATLVSLTRGYPVLDGMDDNRRNRGNERVYNMTVDQAADEIAYILTGQYPGDQPAMTTTPAIKIRDEPKPDMRICTTCGQPFEPYKNGCVSMPICRACLGAKISGGKEDAATRGTRRPYVMELDFTGDQDLFDGIVATAKSQRRTVQQQVLFYLDMATGGVKC